MILKKIQIVACRIIQNDDYYFEVTSLNSGLVFNQSGNISSIEELAEYISSQVRKISIDIRNDKFDDKVSTDISISFTPTNSGGCNYDEFSRYIQKYKYVKLTEDEQEQIWKLIK